jgi:hypothetical protein
LATNLARLRTEAAFERVVKFSTSEHEYTAASQPYKSNLMSFLNTGLHPALSLQ